GPEHGNGRGDMRKRDATRGCGGEGRKQIEDVDFAGETRAEASRSNRSLELDSGARRREPVARGAPIALADAIGTNFRAGLASRLRKLLRVWIVRVQDRDTRRRVHRAVEEQALRGKIIFHRVVVVEMVARQ